ncbi:hypothetical protein [Clostridium botulinum]
MKYQLQYVKNQFTERLFEVIKIQAKCNKNDLFDYYNLIIANIDNHNEMLKNILENGFYKLDYNKDSWGYDDGEIIIYLNNNIQFKIILINEYDNILDIYRKGYNIIKIVELAEISEGDIDENLLKQVKEETEEKLKEFMLQKKQEKLKEMLEERKVLDNDINKLKNELSLF